jgi:hypothetical protein
MKYLVISCLLSCSFLSCSSLSSYYLNYQSDVVPYGAADLRAFQTYYLRGHEDCSDQVMEVKLHYILDTELSSIGKTKAVSEKYADIVFEIHFENSQSDKTVPTRVVTNRVKYIENGVTKYRNVYGASTRSVTVTDSKVTVMAFNQEKSLMTVNCVDRDWGYEQVGRFLFPSMLRHFGVDGRFRESGKFESEIEMSGYKKYLITPTSWERID